MENNLRNLIRVLIVDDSPFMSKILANILNSEPRILVAGIAHNGKEATEIVPRLKPDIITMDIHMPVMDGFEATRQIMAYHPTPILIVSTSVFRTGMNKVFKAISYGALDIIEKGEMDFADNQQSGLELIEKVKFLSTIKVIHHPLAKLEKEKKIKTLDVPKTTVLHRIVAIVSSTGGPEALLKILKHFPEEFPCGIVLVQHITPGFVEGLAEWLDGECRLKVKIAQDSEEIRPGVAYIAPNDLQMRVEKQGRIHLTQEAAFDGHKPSGDILLGSVAETYQDGAVGVILTGMGRDGSIGIKTIKDAGGQTIAQDEKGCVVFGMPKAAIEMNAVDHILPVDNIAEVIVKMLEENGQE